MTLKLCKLIKKGGGARSTLNSSHFPLLAAVLTAANAYFLWWWTCRQRWLDNKPATEPPRLKPRHSAGGSGRRSLDPVPLTLTNPKDKPKFVMKHLTKAGGTFLRLVVERILDDQHRHVSTVLLFYWASFMGVGGAAFASRVATVRGHMLLTLCLLPDGVLLHCSCALIASGWCTTDYLTVLCGRHLCTYSNTPH